MNPLLITENGQIIGQTMDCDNAKRHAIVSLDNVFAVCRQKDLEYLPEKAREALFDRYLVNTIAGLWKVLKTQHFPYWGKVSVQAVMRKIFSGDNPPGYTRDELIAAVPGASWVSITTAMSMLKSTKYAKGPIVRIERGPDDVYRRIE